MNTEGIFPLLRLVSYLWVSFELWSLSLDYKMDYIYTGKKNSLKLSYIFLGIVGFIGILIMLNVMSGWIERSLSDKLINILIIPSVFVSVVARALRVKN